MLREPLQQNSLCLGNRGPDGPERVVQIQADGANLAAVAQALRVSMARAVVSWDCMPEE
jgi:hypothetical protein